MKSTAWMVLAGLALSFAVQGASFDCAKAKTKVEKLVCADDFTIGGDLKPADTDPQTAGITGRYDDLGNRIVGSDADPDHLIQGLGGTDYINALRGGDDTLEGGAGQDLLNGGAGNDSVLGGEEKWRMAV